jgi:hypothetical protein
MMLNSYQSDMLISLKTLYICYLILHWTLSNCLWPLWETFHTLVIKITYTPPIYADFYTGSCIKTFHPSIHFIPQNKSSTIYVDLSLQLPLQKRHELLKKGEKRRRKRKKETMSWTQQGPSIQKNIYTLKIKTPSRSRQAKLNLNEIKLLYL